jgi:RimJ/RimL family protein N-acetyltransferase
MNKIKIEGKQIYLRILTPDDVQNEYVEWMNDKKVTQYLESRKDKKYIASELKDYIRSLNKTDCNYMFGIFIKKNGKHVGNIKLGNISKIHRHADIGLMVGNKLYWGKGVATEALKLVTEFAFDSLKLNKVFAGVCQGNTSSFKVFQNNGFKKAGQLKNHVFFDGVFMDAFILEKINEIVLKNNPQ